MFNAGSYQIQIDETRDFIENARQIFTDEELRSFIDFISKYPDSGDIDEDCVGIRLAKWGAMSQGKDGHASVVYFFRDLNVPLYLLNVLPKSEIFAPTTQEKNMLTEMANRITSVSVRKKVQNLSLA